MQERTRADKYLFWQLDTWMEKYVSGIWRRTFALIIRSGEVRYQA